MGVCYERSRQLRRGASIRRCRHSCKLQEVLVFLWISVIGDKHNTEAALGCLRQSPNNTRSVSAAARYVSCASCTRHCRYKHRSIQDSCEPHGREKSATLWLTDVGIAAYASCSGRHAAGGRNVVLCHCELARCAGFARRIAIMVSKSSKLLSYVNYRCACSLFRRARSVASDTE